MTDNRTTELREKLDDLIIELDRLDNTLDSPASDMTVGEYEQEREHLLDGFVQAIAATLGNPKVKKVRGMMHDEHGSEVYFLACSGCGDWVDGDLDCIGEADGPRFCGHCGGEFDGPLLCRVCGELADMEFGDMCAECYWHEGEGNDER